MELKSQSRFTISDYAIRVRSNHENGWSNSNCRNAMGKRNLFFYVLRNMQFALLPFYAIFLCIIFCWRKWILMRKSSHSLPPASVHVLCNRFIFKVQRIINSSPSIDLILFIVNLSSQLSHIFKYMNYKNIDKDPRGWG